MFFQYNNSLSHPSSALGPDLAVGERAVRRGRTGTPSLLHFRPLLPPSTLPIPTLDNFDMNPVQGI